MKIAIIAPSPVPFGVGGAEKLWWGMQEYINKNTTHQCELIKIPTKENNFWDLIEAYYKFYTLDVSHFDMVISTKYPAWMVQHQNHHIYLQHCLRGLYDTYHFSGLPRDFSSSHPKVAAIVELLQNETTDTRRMFNALFELRSDKTVPLTTYAFPGAFIRSIVHFLDNRAMQQVNNFSAISQTVIDRKEYFPKDTLVQKVYHPSNLTDLTNNAYDYFFTASRLDGAKRIQMIVEAYMKSDTTIPLKIAGAGPLEAELKKLSKNDPRIEFLGFISDTDLCMHYANAYAVLFVPYDEDYGLITIEAAMCEKPVLTFSDSGGVREFIKDKITGLVCQPKISALTASIDTIAKDRELCIKMGKQAKQAVRDITWKNTIEALLNNVNKRRKITVVTTYPIYPPRGGGQNRVYYLYKELAKFITVEVICLVQEGQKQKQTLLAPNFYEITVPKSKVHQQAEWEMQQKAGIPITDIAMLTLYEETPLFKEIITDSYKTSQFLVATQPYTYLLCESITDDPIIHDSQNVEYLLKKQMLKDTPYNQELLQKLFEVEKKTCNDALFTTVCAYDDAETMHDIYGFDIQKAVVVPNGVDLGTVPYISQEQRQSIKADYGFSTERILLFIGSWHQPNIDAVEEIFKIAAKLPDYKFIIMGSVGDYFYGHKKPINVGFTGITTDKEKEMYLSVADIALNPMLTGSGTNLKMLDYMANGIPVVSTHIGARGLDIPSGYIVTCDIHEFDTYIRNIEQHVDTQKSRTYVETNFSWKVIQHSFAQALAKVEEH